MRAARKYLNTTALLVFTFALAHGTSLADTIRPTAVDETRGIMHLYVVENGADVDTYFSGVIRIAVTSDEGVTYNRDSLCVDLFTNINLGTTYDTTVLHPSQVAGKNLTRISWLIDNALLPAYGIPGYSSALDPAYWADDAVSGAALQLAVWDITHNNGDGFSAGSVRYGSTAHPADAGVLAAANYYLAASAGQSSNLAYVYLNIIQGSSPPTQAQMLAGPLYLDDGPHPTPEPATLALAGAALIGLGCVVRRKRLTRPRPTI